MENKISRRVNQVSPSGIRKFFELVIGVRDIISLAVGEPDFITPWRIREACMYSLEKGYTSYTSNWGLLELRELLSEKLESEYGTKYDPAKQILITSGVSEGLDLAIRSILNPGEEVIFIEPSYVSYLPDIIFAGGTPVPVPAREKDGFSPLPEKIEERTGEKTKAILLNYPNNPTGAVPKLSPLKKIVEIAKDNDLIIISDEVYSKLTYGRKHISLASLAPERTILLDGFSKAYAMTGFRLGYAAAPPEIMEAMMKIHQYTMLCAPLPAQMAALEALRDDSDVKEMVKEYDFRRRLAYQRLRKFGLSCVEPEGAFYLFPSIKSLGLSSEKFAEGLLRREKVAVIPGNAFGEIGEGYIRVSYAVKRELLKEGIERIGSFLSTLISGKKR